MTERPKPFRPQISVLTFLLAVTVLCLAVSHWNTSRQLALSQPEVRQLRDELGYISVDDRSKFHAVALDTDEPNTWLWRLFLPKGHRYKWNVACENIPQDVPPAQAGASGVSNEPYWETDNEVLVTARLRQNEDHNWTLAVDSKIGDSKHQMAGTSLVIPADAMDWMFTQSSFDGQVIGSRGTAVREPDGPIILLQRRPTERLPDGSFRPSPNPMPGFMIWLTKW